MSSSISSDDEHFWVHVGDELLELPRYALEDRSFLADLLQAGEGKGSESNPLVLREDIQSRNDDVQDDAFNEQDFIDAARAAHDYGFKHIRDACLDRCPTVLAFQKAVLSFEPAPDADSEELEPIQRLLINAARAEVSRLRSATFARLSSQRAAEFGKNSTGPPDAAPASTFCSKLRASFGSTSGSSTSRSAGSYKDPSSTQLALVKAPTSPINAVALVLGTGGAAALALIAPVPLVAAAIAGVAYTAVFGWRSAWRKQERQLEVTRHTAGLPIRAQEIMSFMAREEWMRELEAAGCSRSNVKQGMGLCSWCHDFATVILERCAPSEESEVELVRSFWLHPPM